jgi:peptidoglycan-associated lipoprotein
MFYKALLLTFLSVVISSCSGTKQNQADYLSSQEELENPTQNSGEFDAVASQEEAEEENKRVQEEIEEVEVADRVFFALNEYKISSEAKEILNNQVAWLKSDDSIKIIVEGHCDERGTREYNIALGERRASAVKNYLVSNGVVFSRIKTISYGKERPAFVGAGNSVWSKNRRAVTVIEE